MQYIYTVTKVQNIASKNKFNVNMDFLISLKSTEGVLDIKEIN